MNYIRKVNVLAKKGMDIHVLVPLFIMGIESVVFCVTIDKPAITKRHGTR
jgi:hypothetical protein